VIDDDAWMRIKRTHIRINPPGSRDNNLRYLWCLPPFTITPACIQAGGQVISPRRLAHFKEDVVRSTRYEMKQWQNAVISYAMDKRIGEEIPDMLDQIWERGLPEGEGGPVIADPAGRRAAILQFWASRSCVSEGEQARVVVADFVEQVIQLSENPASTDEIANANQKQRCTDTTPLELPQVP
jgi:hypothetical protein